MPIAFRDGGSIVVPKPGSCKRRWLLRLLGTICATIFGIIYLTWCTLKKQSSDPANGDGAADILSIEAQGAELQEPMIK